MEWLIDRYIFFIVAFFAARADYFSHAKLIPLPAKCSYLHDTCVISLHGTAKLDMNSLLLKRDNNVQEERVRWNVE